MPGKVEVRRIYEDRKGSGGYRVLVDRIWPRGIRKADAHLDEWMRDVAPSTELRKWYGHDPEKWPEFRERYRRELEDPERARRLDELVERARSGDLVLLCGAKDAGNSQAEVLREVIEERLRR